jgi:hypothetical protein
MSATVRTPNWPSDPDHRDAIDTLLDMASAEDRWGDHSRALVLLDRVQQIVGALPPGYERMRNRCERAGAPLAAVAPRGVEFSHAVVTPSRRGGGRFSRR